MADPAILVAGETLIDFLPERPGDLDTVERFTRRPGGAPANVAVALATLDEVPWFWTRIGADPFGDLLARRLDEYGLLDRFIERDPDAKTTLAFVSHDEDADREFTFYRDDTADTRMESGRADDALEAISWVHLGGVTLASEPAHTATLDLATRARDHGCTVSFDPNARPELWADREEFADLVEEMLSRVDVLKATPEDLARAGFDAADPADLAREVCERGPHTTLVTRGREGAVGVATDKALWTGEATHPGYAVSPVDTTGAGDAFTAGAIAALQGGDGLDEALEFANAVAATTTTATGAMTALPDRETVARFREETPTAE